MQRKKNINSLIAVFLLLGLLLSGCSGDKGQGLEVGTQFPSLELLDLEGRRLTLSGPLKAKIRLISIRTIGCRYCESDFAEFEKIFQQFEREALDVVVIGVACEQEVIVSFMKGKKISFQVFVDETMETMRLTNSVILPVAYVVDSQNRILYKVLGALGRREMAEILPEILAL